MAAPSPTRSPARPAVRGSAYSRTDRLVLAGSAAATALAALTRYVSLGSVTAFAASALAIALLAAVVGRSVDQVSERLGAGATGVVQSALGNLPELFIALFALREGLVAVVQAAIVGSVLANVLLVLGLAFTVGGARHGTQRFDSQRARTIAIMLLLAVAALVMPSLADSLHTPAAGHEVGLSRITAVLLLVVFALSVPASLERGEEEALPATGPAAGERVEAERRWPFGVALGLLAAAGVLAAFVSDWFVTALTPAIDALGVSQAFAGLVVVAIAGNAVENAVGVQLAARNSSDAALSVILNSPLQIALVLAPVLVLVAPLVGGAAFTLVLPPLLIVTLVASVLVTVVVIYDGESNWLEGVALMGLYGVIAAAFWWG